MANRAKKKVITKKGIVKGDFVTSVTAFEFSGVRQQICESTLPRSQIVFEQAIAPMNLSSFTPAVQKMILQAVEDVYSAGLEDGSDRDRDDW